MCPQTQTGQNPYLARLFNPANREAVITESFDIAESRLEADSRAHVDRCWKLTRDLYEGRFSGYRSCNTEYHDFNHILSPPLRRGPRPGHTDRKGTPRGHRHRGHAP